MKKLLLFISLLFLFNSSVYATCSSEERIELNQKAANVKVEYEIDESIKQYVDGTIVKKKIIVSIYNLSEEFYISVKNKDTNEKKNYSADDAVDGVISFEITDLSKVANYTFEIIALSDKTNCSTERFRIIYLTTPRTNEFYYREVCKDNEEFAYCQEYVTAKEISNEEFINKLQKYLEKDPDNKTDVEDENDNNVFINFIVKYKWVIIIVLIVIAAGSTTTILLTKKKQRELGI